LEKKLNIILSPQKLRYYRKAADKIQEEVAVILGVDRTTYNGYEKKHSLEVPFAVAENVAKYLKVTVDDLQIDEKDENIPNSGKHMIEDGNYVALHKLAWDEFQLTRKVEREALLEITKSNANLSETIAEMARNLIRPGSGDQKR
jgi:transcriptional regulator with XRE-family HTH domain